MEVKSTHAFERMLQLLDVDTDKLKELRKLMRENFSLIEAEAVVDVLDGCTDVCLSLRQEDRKLFCRLLEAEIRVLNAVAEKKDEQLMELAKQSMWKTRRSQKQYI